MRGLGYDMGGVFLLAVVSGSLLFQTPMMVARSCACVLKGLPSGQLPRALGFRDKNFPKVWAIVEL